MNLYLKKYISILYQFAISISIAIEAICKFFENSFFILPQEYWQHALQTSSLKSQV